MVAQETLIRERTMTVSVLMQQKSLIQNSSTTSLILEHSNQVNGEALVANMMVVHSGSAFLSLMIQLWRRRQHNVDPTTTGTITIRATSKTTVETRTP